jgi:hypothetical protein
MRLSVKGLQVTLSIMTQCKALISDIQHTDTQHNDTQHNDIQQNDSAIMLIVVLSVAIYLLLC